MAEWLIALTVGAACASTDRDAAVIASWLLDCYSCLPWCGWVRCTLCSHVGHGEYLGQRKGWAGVAVVVAVVEEAGEWW